MKAGNDLERDWSSLPPEVLNLIAKYLYEIIDFVRFRAVCIAWRFSTPIADLPSQFPWILDDRYNSHERGLKFFSVSSNKINTIHASKSINKQLCGSFDGYYLMKYYDQNESIAHYSLLNPLNNDEVCLPACEYLPIWFGHGLNQVGEYIVCFALEYPGFVQFVFCHLGQERWCELKLDYKFRDGSHIYLKGRLFTKYFSGVTKVTDITSGTLIYVVPPVDGPLTAKGLDNLHFVEESRNIFRVFERHNQSDDDILYDVHHLDINNSGFPCWSKVKNIGDYAIFMHLGHNFMLKASDLAGIQANCIYVLKYKYLELYKHYINELKRIDIETNTRRLIRCPFHHDVDLFVPNLYRLSTQQFM